MDVDQNVALKQNAEICSQKHGIKSQIVFIPFKTFLAEYVGFTN